MCGRSFERSQSSPHVRHTSATPAATLAATLFGVAKGATPAIVELEAAAVAFTVHAFEHDGSDRGFGLAAAGALGVDPDRVFKTLLAEVTDSRGAVLHAVGIVPVTAKLSLKDLAAALGVKRAEMCDPRVAERLTGYVVGGISPFGQKKRLRTVVDETSELHETVFVSGGKRGMDLEVAPSVLVSVIDAVTAPIAVW
jgi:Cys-tRNA(Pro)/Cys-tRNA(Cys) deacylase